MPNRRKLDLSCLDEVHFGAPKPIQDVSATPISVRLVRNRKQYQSRSEVTSRRQAEIERAIAFERRAKELLRAVGRLN